MVKTRFNEELLEGLARPDSGRAVLLYSGGVDCTASGLMLQEQGYEVHPLLIDYGQTSAPVERHLGVKAVEQLGFQPTHMVKTDIMQQFTKSKLLGEKAIDDDDAWVPGRNTLFMILAGIHAQQINADGISIGYMLDDNFVFGDNDFFHHKQAADLLSKSFLRPMEALLPARSKTKQDLIKLLHASNFLDLTVSCWNAELRDDDIVTCNNCANCQERNDIIRNLDI